MLNAHFCYVDALIVWLIGVGERRFAMRHAGKNVRVGEGVSAVFDVLCTHDLSDSEVLRVSGGDELPEAKEAWLLLSRDLSSEGAMDLREMGPTRECVCGTGLWRILGSFDDDGDLSFYFLDVVCASCGSVAKAPTPDSCEED